MPCNSPLRAYQPLGGGPVSFVERRDCRTLDLPCGRCRGCRLDRSRSWAVRCVHESQMHEFNSFITLTYADEHLPPSRSLRYPDFQDFMKRLRQWVYRQEVKLNVPADERTKVRYFVAGEYGDRDGRPHYHAILFGVGFLDRVFFKKSGSGHRVYRSPALEALWPFGYSSIGDVTFESAAYVARYVMKKELGEEAGPRRCIVDVTTGEMVERDHEFCHMSLKPGIAASWLEKFGSDVYPAGMVTMNGGEIKPPRFYEKWFKSADPVSFEDLAYEREILSRARSADNTTERLKVKEAVLQARVAFLKRSL